LSFSFLELGAGFDLPDSGEDNYSAYFCKEPLARRATLRSFIGQAEFGTLSSEL